MSEEFKSCKDVLMGLLEEMERQYLERRDPFEMRVSVDWRSRTVRFDPIGYEIDLNLIRDESEIFEWMEQLYEKNWISLKLMMEFTRAALTNLQWMRSRRIA